MIFVDTGAWFALTVPWDANHVRATDWINQNTQPLITTDYIVDETLTLLRVRKEYARAIAVAERMFAAELARICFLEEADIRTAANVFRSFADKEWSFTDCTSKVVLEKFGLTTAFTFDQHFRQFGTVTVVPE